MAWVNFEKYVLKMADFQQILGVNEQIFQIFGKQNADFWAKKYGNTEKSLNLLHKKYLQSFGIIVISKIAIIYPIY